MIINTNDDKQHLIFAKSILILRFIDDFINRVLYINMENGDYDIELMRGSLERRIENNV